MKRSFGMDNEIKNIFSEYSIYQLQYMTKATGKGWAAWAHSCEESLSQ